MPLNCLKKNLKKNDVNSVLFYYLKKKELKNLNIKFIWYQIWNMSKIIYKNNKVLGNIHGVLDK